MRHGKKFNHLGRQASHRKAMLSNMCASLFLHKRITTTVAKAKELRKFVEPLVTRAKEDTTHNRREAFSFLQNKEAIKMLFGEVAEKVGSRPGGYTRIIKTGFRVGDNADMCIIELVDFNELMLDTKPAKKTTRRSRRGSGKTKEENKSDVAATSENDPAADAAQSSPKAKANKEEKGEESASEPSSSKAEASGAEATAATQPETADQPAEETNEAEPTDSAGETKGDTADNEEDGKKDEKSE